ncbi:MAG: M12 family metallo-peptidase [Planctomycetota bacterium]
MSTLQLHSPSTDRPRLLMGLLILSGLLLLLPRGAEGQSGFGGAPGGPSLPDPALVAPLLETSSVEVRTLDFIEVPGTADILVEVEFAGQLLTLSLTPHSVRGDAFRVLVDDGSGTLTEVEPPPIRTRRGTVLEIPGSEVRAHFDGQSLSAQIHTPGGSMGIQPVSDVMPGADPSVHAIYDVRDVLPVSGLCATTGTGSTVGNGGGTGTGTLGGTTYFQTDLAIDCDFEFFQDNLSSVDATVDEVEQIINGVQAAYEQPSILIVYELSTVLVRTSPADPYGSISSPGTLLGTLASVWNSAPENGIQRDVAHLFTGVNLDGSVIGIANLSDICTSSAYGVNQAGFTANNNSLYALIAHELGHNWSATHCNGATGGCKIMCDVLGGCGGINPLAFSPSPAAQIISYRNSRTCLSSRLPPQTVPFLDDFPTTTVNEGRWSYNSGASVSSQGVGEPSGGFSLSLDSGGSGLYADDDFRSNFILLSGVADPHFSFWVQHRGVEAGETLTVEYQTNALDWAVLETFVSDGVDDTVFTFVEYDLPGSANHDQFRIRFTVDVNAPDDDWFIDDVRVGSGPLVPASPPTLIGISPSAGSILGGSSVTVTGSDFQSAASVSIGANLLQAVQVLDSNTIVGIIPPAASTGAVDVTLSQPSGSQTLFGAFTYTSNSIRHGDGLGLPGGSSTVPVTADHAETLTGYSLAVEFDPSQLQLQTVTDASTAAEGAEFFTVLSDNSVGTGGWWTLGVVLSLTGGATIPPSGNTVIAFATYGISASLPLGVTMPVTPVNGAGVPPTENVLVDEFGNALGVILEGGAIVTSNFNLIRHDDGVGAPGGTASASISADHDDTLTGYSFAVDFDPTLLQVSSITDVGTLAEGADFFTPLFDNSVATGGWWTLGVVLSLTGGVTIPPSSNSLLASVNYEIAAGLPLGTSITVLPLDGVGVPATDNVLVDEFGNSLGVVLEGGSILVSGTLFLRADANEDLVINIADPIAVLDYLFNGGVANCLDACDGNDDGSVNIADAIFILDFLFNAGTPPPAPYPAPGSDPTTDPIDC